MTLQTLCITGTPSVATEIGKVIGAVSRKDGYLEGNGYLVTWALGHLVELAEPEGYGYLPQKDIWRKKGQALSELPFLPTDFRTYVIPAKKDQYDIIKNLMDREDVGLIIDCGDMGAQGHYIQWLIRRQANCDKPVKRFCAVSLMDEAINKAMKNLRAIDEFQNVIDGEYCRHKADWVLGMSMSRLLSLKYNGRVDVGRVMSPTLYFVVKRYLDVQKFAPVEHYLVKADLREGFSVFLENFLDVADIASNDTAPDGRLVNKEKADQIAAAIEANPAATVKSIEKKRRATDRPLLYDITELQRDGNRIYGYSAADVLDAAQNLYELKILSSPRTDSRYLTSDLADVLRQRMLDIHTLDAYKDAVGLLFNHPAGLNIDKKIIDDEKVTDHHALIVTEMIRRYNANSLGITDLNILHLIICRMIMALAQIYVYDETTVQISCCGGLYTLTAKGKKTIQQGYKKVMDMLMGIEISADADGEDEEQSFPALTAGQTVYICKAKAIDRHTEAPKLHTEATLLTAMENAGAYIENGEILKGKGIGTPATRAATIKKLFDVGYIINKPVENVNYIEPTKLGVNCIKVLPQDLYSPKITADWETKIAGIVDGKNTADEFMDDFKDFIKRMIIEAQGDNIAGVDFSKKESIGKCPFCKQGEVYSHKGKSDKTIKEIDVYYCSLQCGFILYADNSGYYNNTDRTLLQRHVLKLLSDGSFTARTKYNKMGTFVLVKNESGKAAIKLTD